MGDRIGLGIVGLGRGPLTGSCRCTARARSAPPGGHGRSGPSGSQTCTWASTTGVGTLRGP